MGSTRTIRAPLHVESFPASKSGAGGAHFWALYILFFLVAANVPYWIAARGFGFLPLGWFCVEYLVVGLVALFVPRFVSAILLIILILADLLCAICLTYRMPIHETLASIGFARSFATRHLLVAFLVMLLSLLMAMATLALPIDSMPQKHRRRAAVCLIGLAILFPGFDTVSIFVATGQLPAQLNHMLRPDTVKLQMTVIPRLARIPLMRLVKTEINEAWAMAQEKAGRSAAEVASATAVAMAAAEILPASGNAPVIDSPGAGPDNRDLPNIVQVVVESWGLADAPLREAIVAPYTEPALLARYQVIQGTVPFRGSTIPGESRELCGNTFGYHLLTASASELTQCLPDRLAALGYYPIALHGMNGNFFNRSHWYPAIGFKESWFLDDFRRQGLRDCDGAFVGTCDAEVAAWIGRRLQVNPGRPIFVHWMTLNSHLPVPVPSGLADGVPCMAALSLKPDSPLCSWYQLIASVHRSLARLAEENLGRPTIFIVVGDHTPAFGDPANYHRLSHTEVPYLILLPRSRQAPQSIAPARASARTANLP